MRLLCILITAVSLQVSATGYSQKVTLKQRNASLETLFREIHRQTGYLFLYSSNVLQKAGRVTINVKNAPLSQVLDKCLEHQPFTYAILENTIVVKLRSEAPVFPQLQQTMPSWQDTTITVTGTVTGEAGEPLPGATLLLQGTARGTSTDAAGRYSLKQVPPHAVINVSFTGYEPLQLALESRTILNIQLKVATSSLTETVVVGYGTQKRVNLTGAVAQISGKELENRPVANVGQALQGAVPNLNVSVTGDPGGPGTNPTFDIRGISSINGGGPFYVVDGIPASSIADINPNDIETLTVLKDAAASAIYGARAPYGVILITTKRGRKDGRLTVSYNNMFAMSTYIRLPRMANALEFAEAYNLASLNSGQSAPFSPAQIEKIKKYMADPNSVPVNVPDPTDPNKWNYASPLSNDNVDWFRAFFKPWSFNQKHDLSVNGGTRSTTYYMGLGYYNQGGQLRYGNEVFERYNLTSNVHTEPTKWLRLDLRTRFTRRKTDIPYPYASQLGNWIHSATTRWPTWQLKEPDGHFSTVSSIEFMRSGGRSISSENNLFITGAAEVEPVKNWKINLDYSYNNATFKNQQHSAYVYSYAIDGSKYNIGPSQNSISEGMISDGYRSFNLYSSYERSWGKHYAKILAGQQIEIYDRFDVSGSRTDLITDDIPSISTAVGTQNAYDEITDWSTMGTFARLNYNYDEKYLLEVNGRYDGTSKFPEGRRFGLFPSISAGYNIARENFWRPLEKYVNEFKLRASYGSLGNQNVGNYLYLPTIGIGTNMGYIINNVRPNYLLSPGLISPDLTWETSRTFNIGLDAAFLENRLSLSFDRYTRSTLNMLGPARALPALLGTAVPVENNADLKTKGFELNIGWRDRIGKELSYNVSFVLSDYSAVIERYYNPTKILTTFYEGKQFGEIWGYRTEGLIRTEKDLASMPDQSYLYGNWSLGDVRYKDLNGDGKIDPGKNTRDDHGDLAVIGNDLPRYSYSLNAGLNWKGIDFTMFWQGVAKRDVWLGGPGYGNGGNLFWGFTDGFGNNVYKTTLDYWTPGNPGAYWPKPYASVEVRKNQQTQSGYLQSAAYLRLKNLQLGYSLPQRWLDRVKLQRARVFASAENLLTFSRINKNFDPEVIGGNWGNGKIYPLLKTVSLGLNLSF